MAIINIYVNFILFFIGMTSAWDYAFERIENMVDPETAHIVFDMKVIRVNRTNYSITGNVTFRAIFTQNPNMYHHLTNFYYSSLGNNQYNLLPARFARESFCSYINTSYRKYLMPQLQEPISNAPYSDDPNEDLCQKFRSDHDLVFDVCDFVFDKSVIPPYVHEGMYKIEMQIDADDKVVGGATVYIRTETESDD